MARTSTITLNDYYQIKKLKADMDAYVGYDISQKGRHKEHVDAKRAFSYVARSKGYRFQHIAEALGQGHDNAMYHNRKAAELIEWNDAPFINLLNEVYDMDIENGKDPKDVEIRELKAELAIRERLTPFVDIMDRIPAGKVWEVRERLELFLKGYSFKNTDSTKVYQAADTEMVGIF